jgi:ketosteroid isomerase-like protein
MSSSEDDVRRTIDAINAAWRENRPREMSALLHPDIIMAFPAFSGTLAGRDALLASFDEFCLNARVLDYREFDLQVHVVGDTAVVTFTFAMAYERAAYREHSTGRDFWIFARQQGQWIAVWRTMMDLSEQREPA